MDTSKVIGAEKKQTKKNNRVRAKKYDLPVASANHP